MKNQIKGLRVRIDGLSQLVKELKPIYNEIPIFKNTQKKDNIEINDNIIGGDLYGNDPLLIKSQINSDEINKSYDSLILAKAWLGKILQELGEETPYKNDGKRKTVEDIEPTVDKNTSIVENWEEQYSSLFHIQKVDWLRESIKDITDTVIDFGKPEYAEIFTKSREIAVARTNTYNYLSEARFWLGFELGRCRDENNK